MKDVADIPPTTDSLLFNVSQEKFEVPLNVFALELNCTDPAGPPGLILVFPNISTSIVLVIELSTTDILLDPLIFLNDKSTPVFAKNIF